MTYKLHTKNLATLLAVEPQLAVADRRTLSLYLPVRSGGFDAAHYELQLNHLESRYRDRLGEDEAELMHSELTRLRAHLQLVRPAACPALAAFSNESARLLALIRLPAAVEARIEVGPPLLEPLELMLMSHPPALVVVVDKEEARIFASVLGEVVALGHLTGREVRHSRQGGTSAGSNQRKADNRARANLKLVVVMLEKQVRRAGFGRLFVAGPDEARAELLRDLPSSLLELVAGELSLSLDATPGRLLSSIREQMSRMAPEPAG